MKKVKILLVSILCVLMSISAMAQIIPQSGLKTDVVVHFQTPVSQGLRVVLVWELASSSYEFIHTQTQIWSADTDPTTNNFTFELPLANISEKNVLGMHVTVEDYPSITDPPYMVKKYIRDYSGKIDIIY